MTSTKPRKPRIRGDADRGPREVICGRVYADAKEHVVQLAAHEAGGNVSEMVRRLLSEAIAHRLKGARR